MTKRQIDLARHALGLPNRARQSYRNLAPELMTTNQAPVTKWVRAEMACGTVRHRLYVNGGETPFFIDDAKAAGIGHRTMGETVGLFGAGMGPEIMARGGSYRIAATLGAFRNVGVAKARAEQLALA